MSFFAHISNVTAICFIAKYDAKSFNSNIESNSSTNFEDFAKPNSPHNSQNPD